MTKGLVRTAGGRPAVRKLRGSAFSPRRQQAFLDALALTCNITHAAAHAKVNVRTAFRLRERDPRFAARWQEAIARACDRLELLVLEHGGAGVPLEAGDADRAAEEGAGMPFDFNRAVTTLKLFRSQREGQVLASATGARRVATRDELSAALVRALAAVRRGLAAQDAGHGATSGEGGTRG